MKKIILLALIVLLTISCSKNENSNEKISNDYSNVEIVIDGYVRFGARGNIKFSVRDEPLEEIQLFSSTYPNGKFYERGRRARVGDKLFFASSHDTDGFVSYIHNAVKSFITIRYPESGKESENNGRDVQIRHKVLSYKDKFREVFITIPSYSDVKSGKIKLYDDWDENDLVHYTQ